MTVEEMFLWYYDQCPSSQQRIDTSRASAHFGGSEKHKFLYHGNNFFSRLVWRRRGLLFKTNDLHFPVKHAWNFEAIEKYDEVTGNFLTGKLSDL